MQLGKLHFEKLRKAVIEKIGNAEVKFVVVVMPDFFLDHSLAYDFDARTLARRMLTVASRGGGEISDVHQSLEVGGNAAICTLALARLGASVRPIMKTNALGLALMRHFYEPQGIDLSRIKLTGSLSPTAILELSDKSGSANIMLGDSSSITPFSFEDFDSDDLGLIDRSRYVCVFNWLYNKRGTDLAEDLFGYCRKNSRARTFFDAADPTPRAKELPDLSRRVLKKELIDMWGMNENEALIFAKLYKRGLERHGKRAALEAGKVISANTGTTIYLHTAEYSASIRDDEVAAAPSLAITPRRGTGAGDSWNAGIMVAHELGLTEEEGLLFANTIAGKYVANLQRVHSTISDTVAFLNDSALRLKSIKDLERLQTN
ncbi:MAG TPA: PfkB family carbohydrate kinase [archaeon]|nr:PfkB family carbohydrate kinase [archaeon]